MSIGALAGLGMAPASAHVSDARASQPSAVTATADPSAVTPDVDSHGCAAHSWCMWTLFSFTGTRYTFNYNSYPHNEWLFIGNNQNDEARSIDNNRAFITFVGKSYPVTASVQTACSEGAVGNLENHSWPNGTSASASISAILFATSADQVCGTAF
jgi:hypothetical protein